MKSGTLNGEFGINAKNRMELIDQNSLDGALACLETFYYCFNNRDLNTLKKIWYNNDLAQLNNPIGGIVRAITPIANVYDRIFNGTARVYVNLKDIVYYSTPSMVVFAGTEVGEFITRHETIALKIRTSRIFGYVEEEQCWLQLHHHGSIDDAGVLVRYQEVVKK